MRLTTKGRYAVTAMMELAIHGRNGPITLNEIAEHQDISLSYLEQLFARLRRNGLVEGTRGPGGGYRLAKPANDITVADVITAVDEKLDATRCSGKENCQEGERCLTHALWTDLSQQIYDFLDGITLANLVDWPCVREVAEGQSERREQAANPKRSVA